MVRLHQLNKFRNKVFAASKPDLVTMKFNNGIFKISILTKGDRQLTYSLDIWLQLINETVKALSILRPYSNFSNLSIIEPNEKSH